jgi:flavin-dependent dehydrogenase
MAPEILILGGGPSGLSTALHLVQRAPHLAARILVLEKARYPRHKLCGGALTPDAEVILQGLGLDVSEIPHVDASEAHVDFAGRGVVIAFRGRHALRMIRRDEFDAWLAAKVRLSGVQIREGVTVRRVVPQTASVTVETDAGALEAGIVVGADGSNGVARRSIIPNAPIHTARALELLLPAAPKYSETEYVSGVLPDTYSVSDLPPLPRTRGEGLAREARASEADGRSTPTDVRGRREAVHAPNVAYFDFAPVPQGIAGYTWDFPTQLNGEPMRCWGIYDTNLLAARDRPPLKTALQDELRRHGASLTDVEVQGHPIRWFGPRSQLSVPRVLLVGDAAGVDGIFGEGISIALGYGRVAAESILDALRSGDLSFSTYRRRVLLSPFGQALTVRTAITYVLYWLHWAWFQRFFWRVFTPVVTAVSLGIVLNWARRMKWGALRHG